MVETVNIENKIQEIRSDLNSLHRSEKLENIISNTNLGLNSALASNRNLFITDEINSSLQNINTRFGTMVADATTAIVNKVGDRATLPAGASSNQTRANLTKAIDELLEITGGTSAAPGAGSTNFNNRRAEYNNFATRANRFNLANNITDQNIRIGVIPPVNIGLDAMFLGGARGALETAPNIFNYTLCDDNGKEIKPDSFGRYELTVGGQTIQVSGISFTPVPPGLANNLSFTNIQISPANTTLTEPIKLSINGNYKNVTGGKHVVHNKKFNLNLQDGIPCNTPLLRNTEFDSYNTDGGGTRIADHLNTRNDIDLHNLERQAIERAVKDGNGPKYDQLTAEQKEQFYQHIRSLNHPTIAGPDFFGALNPTLNLNSYNHFRNWFTHDDRDWNRGENISTKRKYNDFIHNNLESKSTEYINKQLDSGLLDNLDTNRVIKSELTVFLDRIEKNKQDDNTHRNVDSDMSAKSHKMKKGPRSLLNNRDKNYMRFFADSSKQIDNQEVNINTNTNPEDLNNPQPVKYKVKLDVSGRNNIQVSIDIEGEQKEIIVKSGDSTALVRRVMKDQRIKHGKVRAHIAYNIYKGMIQMAHEKDISLSYRQDNEHMKQVDIDADGNIVLKTTDSRTNRNTTNKTTTEVLFDQQMFKNTNDFDEAGYNGSLRHGIEDISKHFNFAMNDVHEQYRRGVKRRLFNMIKSPSRPKLPTSIWLSPIKKLLNFRTSTKFDFDTTVESNGKQISIKFEKNKFTVNMDGLKKEVSSRDLGKILRKRQGRKRVFDGMERDIVEGVYSAMIGQLRTNAKIARSNFGAIDSLTGNMYVLDEDGQFGVITKEQLDSKRNPVHWGVFSRNKYGVLSRNKLRADGYQVLDETKTKEVMKNPFVMQRFMKAMNNRMGFWESGRAIFN